MSIDKNIQEVISLLKSGVYTVKFKKTNGSVIANITLDENKLPSNKISFLQNTLQFIHNIENEVLLPTTTPSDWELQAEKDWVKPNSDPNVYEGQIVLNVKIDGDIEADIEIPVEERIQAKMSGWIPLNTVRVQNIRTYADIPEALRKSTDTLHAGSRNKVYYFYPEWLKVYSLTHSDFINMKFSNIDSLDILEE
jgi:hypothetical protein